MTTDRPRPCKLQVNTSGAWRNVMDFDALDGDAVMERAAALFAHSPGAALRIMGDTVDTAPLMIWSQRDGWRQFRLTPKVTP